MSDLLSRADDLSDFIRAVRVEPGVFTLRPDYCVMLIAVDGLEPGQSDETSESLLIEAEAHARDTLAVQDVTEVPHVAAWRETYRAFGAKPQRTRNSLEGLLRRVDSGLPRVNRLTDTYNAISVKHQVPIGGEDLDQYVGPQGCIWQEEQRSLIPLPAVRLCWSIPSPAKWYGWITTA